MLNNKGVEALNSGCKAKTDIFGKLIPQFWSVAGNVVLGSTRTLIQEHLHSVKSRSPMKDSASWRGLCQVTERRVPADFLTHQDIDGWCLTWWIWRASRNPLWGLPDAPGSGPMNIQEALASFTIFSFFLVNPFFFNLKRVHF